MKRKIDFVIRDNKYTKTTFRFYPRKSNVHGFNDEPPKTWDAVYKVYFAFSILELDKDSGQCIEAYVETFDECSCIDEVASHIKNMDCTDGEIIEKCRPFGDGSRWMIEKFRCETEDSIFGYTDEEEFDSYYNFFVWHTYSGVGYQFQLDEEKALEFANVIDEYMEYMLQHSQGI